MLIASKNTPPEADVDEIVNSAMERVCQQEGVKNVQCVGGEGPTWTDAQLRLVGLSHYDTTTVPIGCWVEEGRC